MKKSTEILVIGGGITGVGILFDLVQRGFKAILVERKDLSTGTSGRFHGLLHSGGRYAVKDAVIARECYEENQILRRIIPHAIEDTGGLFVVTPEDAPDFGDTFVAGCAEATIPVEEISIAEMLRRETLLNPAMHRAFAVPDGSVDTWDASHALIHAAAALGGQTLTYHKVVALPVGGNQVRGAIVQNVITGQEVTIECDMVVNATGAWAGQIAAMAGCDVNIAPGKGTMIAMSYRMVNTVINRCAMPGDGDILVPVGTVAVIGTTSIQVADPDEFEIEDWEVKMMFEEGQKLIPSFKQFRPLRAWAGVRPLYQEKAPASDDTRDVTRNHKVLDHTIRDGVDNFVSIVGGKWTTYRLMAQDTVDAVCRKLNTDRPCRTAETFIPAEHGDGKRYYRLGERLEQREHTNLPGQLICECELVTRSQIEAKLAGSDTFIINDLRRDLRVGMGPCQGGFCAYRVAGIMHQSKKLSPHVTNQALLDFLQGRWKGIKPTLWGQQLRQMQLDEGIYFGLLGLDKLPLKDNN